MNKVLKLPTKNELYPYDPSDPEQRSQDYWCARLGLFVKLTLNIQEGFYIVTTTEGREYAVRGHELAPGNSKAANRQKITESSLFSINKSNYQQIKNLLVENFIPSFPWQEVGEVSAAQIREKMLALAKHPQNGLTRLIEEEKRKGGIFLDKPSFIERMNKASALQEINFPWDALSAFLDYSQAIT